MKLLTILLTLVFCIFFNDAAERTKSEEIANALPGTILEYLKECSEINGLITNVETLDAPYLNQQSVALVTSILSDITQFQTILHAMEADLNEMLPNITQYKAASGIYNLPAGKVDDLAERLTQISTIFRSIQSALDTYLGSGKGSQINLSGVSIPAPTARTLKIQIKIFGRSADAMDALVTQLNNASTSGSKIKLKFADLMNSVLTLISGLPNFNTLTQQIVKPIVNSLQHNSGSLGI